MRPNALYNTILGLLLLVVLAVILAPPGTFIGIDRLADHVTSFATTALDYLSELLHAIARGVGLG